MIAAQQEEVLRIFDFVRQQQADGLQRLLAPVDVVAEEQIVGARRKAAVLEQPQQIGVLAVDVACARTIQNKFLMMIKVELTANDQRRFQLQQDRLLQEDLAGFDAQATHLRFGHLHRLAGSVSTHCRLGFWMG